MCTCSLAKESNTSVTVTKGQAIAYRCQPIAYLKSILYLWVDYPVCRVTVLQRQLHRAVLVLQG